MRVVCLSNANALKRVSVLVKTVSGSAELVRVTRLTRRCTRLGDAHFLVTNKGREDVRFHAFTLAVVNVTVCDRPTLLVGVVGKDTAKAVDTRVEVFGIVLERSGVITSAAGRCGALVV